jgi:hypothetical protein
MGPGRSGLGEAPRPDRPAGADRAAGLGVIVIGGALAVLASFTTPFTLPADLVVGAGFVALAAVLVAQARWSPTPSVLARQPLAGPGPRRWSAWLLWIVPFAAIVGFELFNYTRLPRSAHPTLSSMVDSLTSSHPGHAVAFGAWLALGWYLVRR